MAPLRRINDKDERLHAVLKFAKRAIESLEHPNSALLVSELYTAVDKVTSLDSASSVNARADFDKLGTTLWNLSTKEKGESKEDKERICLLRLFACLLIECAQRGVSRSTSNDVRVLKCTVKAAKCCLDRDHLDLAEIAIEKAATYEERLKDLPREHDASAKSPVREYSLLRIALAWRQGRLDMASLMYSKAKVASGLMDCASMEQLADTLFEIGKDQTKRDNHLGALTWLESAYDELSSHNPSQLSSDATELKMCTMHYLVKAHIQVGGEDHRSKAWNLIQDLSLEYGEGLAVALLKLDLYGSELNPSPRDYADILGNICRTVHLTQTNVKTILHHVHRLKVWQSSLAQKVLLGLIQHRLLDGEQVDWLEKAMITMIWITTASSDISNAIEDLTNLFDQVANSITNGLGAAATHAAHMLLWKSIDSCYQQQQYQESKAWCRLSLHKVLKGSGTRNVGKLQRRLMLCALDLGNPNEARDIHAEMSSVDKNEAASCFLLYKAALRCRELDLASQCLELISNDSTRGPTILYACVLEAQKSGHQSQSIMALQKVLQKYDFGAPDCVHLPALLRCTARLLVSQVEKDSDQSSRHILDDLCNLFEGAASQAKESRRNHQTSFFTVHELDWFSRNSYNLALKHCSTWPHQYTERIISSCIKFIDLYPIDQDSVAADDLNLRKLFCHFLTASLLTAMARLEELVESQLQHYLGVRKAVDSFRVSLPNQTERLGEGPSADLQRKFLSLLAYDFEAAAHLKAWDSFQAIVKECEIHGNAFVFSVLADIVLASEAPTNVTITTLQQIINATWSKGENDISKLSRWIRCLFSLALSNTTGTAEQLLEQAISVIQSSKAGSNSSSYPAEELEWLATTTFNHAIDFYCSGQEVECCTWAEQALRLADLAADNGALHQLLQEKYQALSWQGH